MAEDNPKYNLKLEDQAKGLAVGDNNIIYNYFGYREEVKAAPVDVADDNLPCPYRGLYHFNPNDAEYFFGREVFVEELFEATKTRNFIPVLGASGSGKSSVVLAGLIPKLEQEQKGHWKFTHFRPGSDPFHALALALVPLYRPELDATDEIIQARKLAKSLSNNQDSGDQLPLSDVFAKIKQNNPDHRILLIADQFEELYTQCSDSTVRRRFLDCLLASFQSSNSGASSSTVLVTTMRADFLANALSYRPFADMLQNADIKLGAMSRKELTEVIEKPVEKLGVTFEAGLVERILDDVEDEPGNLPLLEFALTELWEKRTGKQLTHDAYEAIGQVKGALADYADDKYKNLTVEEQEQARRIFIQLVRPGEGTEDTRRRANRAELGEENWNLITRKDGLTDSRLVVTNRNDIEQETVEVVHEALIHNWQKLQQWMETDRDFRVWQEQLRTLMLQWKSNGNNADYLLKGKPLADAEYWQQEHSKNLSSNEQKFIKESIKKEKRRRQRTTIFWMSITSVFACLAMLALLQMQKAQIQEIKALTVSSEALLLSNQNFDALIASIRAGRLLNKSLFKVDLNTRIRLLEALQKAMYGLRERNRLEDHTAPVRSVSFSPDGKMLASGSDDGTVKLWSSEGKLLATLEADKTVVRSLSFSPDGKMLASAGDDLTVKLWSSEGEWLETLRGHQTGVNSVSFSPDGKMLASAGDDGTVKLWDSDGELDDTLKTHTEGKVIWSVSFSPDDGERLLASGEHRGSIKLWKLQDDKKWKLDKTLPHGSPVYKIRFSQDGEILASAGLDGIVKLWNGQGQLLSTCEGHDKEVTGLSFSPTGEILATASADGTIKFWHWNKDSCQQLTVPPPATIPGWLKWGKDLSFSPDGQLLAVATEDWQIKLLEVGDTQLPQILKIFPTKHPRDIMSMSLSPDDNIIATGDLNGTIKIHNISDGAEINTLKGHNNKWIYDLDFSHDGELLASGGRDDKICLWKIKITEKEKSHCDSLQHESLRPLTIDFSHDGQILASGSTDGKFHLWNLGDKKPFFSERSHGDKDRGILVWDVDISPDNQTIAIVGQDGSIKLFSRKDEKLFAFPHGHKGVINSVSFHPDGKILATASADGTVKLWNLKGKLLDTLEGYTNEVLDVSFSRDGKMLASASNDGTVKLWELKVKLWNLKGEFLNTFHSHQVGLKKIRFSRDVNTLISVSGGSDRAIILWNLEDFTLDKLLNRGCNLLRNYFQNNIHVSQEDRRFCSR